MYKVGDRVMLNPGEVNEMHGTIEEIPIIYFIRWDDSFHQSLNHPVGPYQERRLYPEAEWANREIAPRAHVEAEQKEES